MLLDGMVPPTIGVGRRCSHWKKEVARPSFTEKVAEGGALAVIRVAQSASAANQLLSLRVGLVDLSNLSPVFLPAWGVELPFQLY